MPAGGFHKRVEFTVEGTGNFPIDMLRYDQCWPKAEGVDSATIERSFRPRERERYSVTLQSDAPNTPTEGRWESFGFRVSE